MKQATLTGKQARKIVEVFEDIPLDQVQAVLESGFLTDLRDADIAAINRDEFRRVCGLESFFLLSPSEFPLTINYSFPLAEAIAEGHYNSINNDITANHFPGAGVDTVELAAQLYHFNKVMESDDVLKELDKLGLRPATLRELLVFGVQHPNTQRQFPITALGSVWQRRDGYRGVPVLWSNADGRSLGLYWCNCGWLESFRFLAFRK